MKTLSACLFLLLSASPAKASDLYHCTVNDVTDGYFQTTDLKVDGSAVSGYTTIQGVETELGKDTFGYFYKGENGNPVLSIVFQEGRERTESLSFQLRDVVSKLGTATRYSAKEGFGEISRDVSMICDIAVPD
ncbi:MAG: hypothetical protein ACXVB9_17290 [Bdellovibrionota bacterium]